MGHKVHPNGFRLGVYRNWEAKWFAPDKEYKPLLLEDVRLRRMLMIRLKNAGLARIETERSSSALTITLHTAKPGIVIGKGGTSVDQLRDELEKITGKRVRVTIQEIKKPQLEKRIAFRRAIKQSLMKTMRAGAQGVKIRVKGRLGGSEMARVEWNREGRVPLHTLKADIDFGQTEAKTTFGRIGVSAWVYTGNFPTEAPPKPAAAAEEPADTGIPVAVAIGEAPTPLAELVQAAVLAPAPAPEAVPAAAPVTAEVAAAAKPKRATRATKATTAEATTTDAGEKAAPKRTTRARAATTDKPEAPKAPRPRATKKKE
jgi:small subunit ribosomal protein S3